jgi:hypothetical protein
MEYTHVNGYGFVVTLLKGWLHVTNVSHGTYKFCCKL